MSAEQLKFKGMSPYDTDFEISKEDGKVKIELLNDESYTYFSLDRGQAHLLMLYLQDYLK